MKKIHHILLVLAMLCLTSVLSAQEQANPSASEKSINVQVNTVLDPVETLPPPENLQTEIFQLKFVRPQDIVDMIREAMGAAPGGVLVHESSHELEITAPPETLEKLKRLVADLDKKRSITLEVKVVQVDLNDEHRSGINWSAIVSNYKTFIASEDNRTFSTGTISQDDYAVLLEALETVGETKVFPVSTVVIVNGQDSDLRVKAFDKNVTVSIIPAVSTPERQDRYSARLLLNPSANSDDAVNVRISSDDGKGMVVHVKKDSLAIIGGIFTQTKIESTKKFPFLGDLPLFGMVFRDQNKVEHRLENIIFLTPHVTTPNLDLP